AINIPWTEVFEENGQIRDADALVRQMRQAGISPEDEIIAYCTAGIRSAHLVLALREAGFAKARNYDASFHEWAGDSALPLEGFHYELASTCPGSGSLAGADLRSEERR